jgi:hypothetical protein
MALTFAVFLFILATYYRKERNCHEREYAAVLGLAQRP